MAKGKHKQGAKVKGPKIAKKIKKVPKVPKIKKKWGSKDKDRSEKPNIQLKPTQKRGPVKSAPEASGSANKLSLRDKMLKRLSAARFRQVNEELDSVKNTNPADAFGSEQGTFAKYHETYRERIQHWPVNPLDLIVSWIKESIPESSIIADFGCGEGRLAQSVPHTVHSFDLFSLNDRVTACDMSNVPLGNDSVHVAVYCLSLMGIDIGKFICEANRVLQKRGILKIAEVASRFQSIGYASFVQKMKKFGFVLNAGADGNADADSNVFYMFEFRKIRAVNQVNGKFPKLKLSPCMYKKR